MIAVASFAFALGIGASNFAMSSIPSGKVAVVDVSAVVANSKQVKALKDEQVKKAQDLAKWLDTVKADVQKQSTEANKKKMLDKYTE